MATLYPTPRHVNAKGLLQQAQACLSCLRLPTAGRVGRRRQAAQEGLEARVGAQAESVVAGGDDVAEFLE